MRRTQLYLDDNLWNALHASARSRKTSISELVREAVRERYLGNRDERMKAMQEFVGVRKQTAGTAAVEYVQSLRRGSRLDRLDQARKA
jgi:metal-responsive CopG/Arc/MetJ family transcriptional regulator